MTDEIQSNPEKPAEIQASPPPPTFSTTTMTPGVPNLLASLNTQVGLSIQQGAQPVDALTARMTESHISQVISQAENEGVRKHAENMAWMKLTLAIAGIGVAGFLLVCVVFLAFSKAELLQPIIQALIIFLGGFGFGRASSKKSDADKT